MQLIDFIVNNADSIITDQNRNGSLPSGHNGPYFDNETPVRNTAHWLFTFSVLYQKTGNQKYLNAANLAADYLLSDEARPMGSTFWCRKDPEKDFCNGVVGQAWVLEALITASKILNRDDCYKLAEEVFLLHPWDEKNKIWRRVNVDGSYSSPDSTFNHQLWFGAIAGFLNQTNIAQRRSVEFFENVAQKVELYEVGVIIHNSPIVKYKIKQSNLLDLLRALRQKKRIYQMKNKLWHKSAGYHGFNLYAYSLYRKNLPNHPFWGSKKFHSMLLAIKNKLFIKEQADNKYSFPYNPTGFEIAYALETFRPEKEEKIQWWLRQQLKSIPYLKHGLRNDFGNILDNATANARIYEATRLQKNYTIS